MNYALYGKEMCVFYRKSVSILYACKHDNHKSSYVEEQNITHCTYVYVTNENRPGVWEKRNLTHIPVRALSHQSKKVPISFLHVRPFVSLSVSPHSPVRLPLDGFP